MIIVKISDGLGNQLFQYAYALYLQEAQSQRVLLDCSDINNNKRKYSVQQQQPYDHREFGLNAFEIQIGLADKKQISRFVSHRKKPVLLRYADRLLLLYHTWVTEKEVLEESFKYRRIQNYYVEGYFFSTQYYSAVKDKLLEQISLKNDLALRSVLKSLPRERQIVSVHYRRGDFLQIGRNISESSYYEDAIRYMEERVGDIFLLVFSDDTEWVKEHIRFSQPVAFASDYQLADAEELLLMSSCDHNIIANSTYSFWGALLNQKKDKIVISPKNWRKKIKPKEWVEL